MRLKMRYANANGFIQLENNVQIKEVMINEDFMHPTNESIAIGFRNKGSSGLIEFTIGEFEKLLRTVERKKHLIKNIKVWGGRSGAIKVED